MLKSFPEKDYTKILNSVGRFSYCQYDKTESLPCDFFSRIQQLSAKSVVAGTGATIASYTIQLPQTQNVVIPQNSNVLVIRFFKEDYSHGEPHYNAYDQLVFPDTNGNVWRLHRKDTPDHFIKIAELSGAKSIADAYNLPKEKFGPVHKYFERGASLHLELKELKNKTNNVFSKNDI